MGWQSDWLYQLIFDEVEKIWKRAKKEGALQLGSPPTHFQIREMGEGDWESIRCRGEARRQWLYQGRTPEPTASPLECDDLGEQNGMFYERGTIEFFIDADRKRVLFTCTLGPRYGRGYIFRIVGQGTKGRLKPCAGPAWVS